ncbi:MAG: hypothetical protein K8S16_00250, partial [Bacteroidales bacterium]|nr:hypothetical protein [Bacteroidales bacterium]
MKKLVLLFSAILMASVISFGQLNDCTLKIDSVDATGLNPGDLVNIPVRMVAVDGVVMGFEFYVLFDNTVFSYSSPGFLQNKNPLFPGNWFEAINENVTPTQHQFAANWLDPNFVGVAVPPNDVLFELQLTYNGGLVNPGDISIMSWNFSKKISDNYQIKGVTGVVNGSFGFYNIIPIDGGLYLPPDIPTENYWTGVIDEDWDNPGNWSLSVVPGPGDDVIINDVSKAPFPTIYGSAATGFL